MPMRNDMSNFNYELLLKDDLVLLVSRSHPFAAHDTVSLSELSSENFISYYNTISHRVLSDRLCKDIGNFEPNYIYETHDEYVVLHLVSQNKGVTLIPEKFYLSRPYDNIKVVKLDKTIACELVLAWDKNHILSNEEKAFLDFSKNWFSKL